jgi:hypothetical protein
MSMTEDKLKQLKSFPEFLVELQKLNERLQRSDRAIMLENARITPVTPYKELVSNALQKLDNLQNSRRAHYDERKKEIEQSQQRFSHHGLHGGRQNRIEGADSADEGDPPRRVLIYGDDDTDDDIVVEAPLPPPGRPFPSDVPLDPVDAYDTVDSLYRLEHPSRGPDKRDPKQLVCFEKIEKGKCDIRDCQYNHKTEDCRNYVVRAFLKASRSPLVTSEELVKLVTQSKSPSSASPTVGLPSSSAIPRFRPDARAGAGSLPPPKLHSGSLKELVGLDGVSNPVSSPHTS